MNHEEAVKLCESVGLRVRGKGEPVMATVDLPSSPISTHPIAAALIVQHMQARTREERQAILDEWISVRCDGDVDQRGRRSWSFDDHAWDDLRIAMYNLEGKEPSDE